MRTGDDVVSNQGPTASANAADLKVVPLRHPGRWAGAVVVAVLAAMLINTLFFSHVVRNDQVQPRFQWGIIDHYFFTSEILKGLLTTLEITVLAMVIGIVFGVVLAVMRLSPNPIVGGASWLYIWFFRGTPVYVQILFWYNIAYVFPPVSIGVPFGPSFLTIHLATALTGLDAAVLALGLNEGAYMAEIVRAGIISVDVGQTEAAQSLGMRRTSTMRRIVLPQAMRLIIPVTGNETISMLKTSSLAVAAAVGELTFSVVAIYSQNYLTVPLLMVASLWYLVVTTILTIGQYFLERHYSRGSGRPLRTGFLEKLWENLSRRRPNQPMFPEEIEQSGLLPQ